MTAPSALAQGSPDIAPHDVIANNLAASDLVVKESGIEFPAGVVQHIPWGILAVDMWRRVLFANALARSMLDARCGFELRGGQVRILRAHADRQLQELLGDAFGRYDGLPANRTASLGVPDTLGRTRYAVRVAPCTVSEKAAALLVVADLFSSVPFSRSAAARTFRLSAREAELAEHFSVGLRLDAIALLMGISANTARIHLGRVLAKTGCADQVELARLLAFMP